MHKSKEESKAPGRQSSRATSEKASGRQAEVESEQQSKSCSCGTEASEDKAKFVPVLADIMTKAEALKPADDTTNLQATKAAWQAALQRRAVVRSGAE